VGVKRPVERIAYTPTEAAEALGVSRDHFDRFIRDELRLVRRGRLILVGVDELRRWVERSSAMTIGGA
jgi:excisionase family DNA binding protein